MTFLKNGSGSYLFKKRLRLPNTEAEQIYSKYTSSLNIEHTLNIFQGQKSNPVMSDPDPHSHADPDITGQIQS